ncbi:type I glutamate--ammonia ligase [Halobacillus litoralis]|uniref:Glutamine synthetase n=1 Tax=Halobacillus litoralis TaxID=45668 RepID=A0A845DZS0_9BACI|nr:MULTISPECIES: type I glutamate--ammonia ligase [Halobacillus]MYL18934.1 type I glutamate--ammonia ligase [Halobacillus litoralis]MYL31125.1 type I glutamate--ammonia ligase [Halobacillus halophilus]MYL39434.1 type I glutamate--ammonia ligase [Halobacillus litoralis]
MGYTKEQIIHEVKENKIEFLILEFTDMLGDTKNVELPVEELEMVLENEAMFDSSSISGFSDIQESDMYLYPDLDTFLLLPSLVDEDRSARFICDIYKPDGTPFEGDPRFILKRAMQEAEDMGYSVNVGPEPEFFLFKLDSAGYPIREMNDRGGYFDASPKDKGDKVRRDIVRTLKKYGFEMEASHHEVAMGQHEINFRFDSMVKTADNIQTFKNVVKDIATNHDYHATFMPKPISGENGSGMHCHLSLFQNGDSAFYDEDASDGISKTMKQFIAGILHHASGIAAITNPNVNSYKRLVPGYEAPVSVAWSHSNRSCMVRVPTTRGKGTRFEVRNPDPTANPYLTLAVLIQAGLDGIKKEMDAGEAESRNLYEVEDESVPTLPTNLKEALGALNKDDLLLSALGEHTSGAYIEEKQKEWTEYSLQVSKWEIEKYMNK